MSKKKSKTKAGIFIVESLDIEDELKDRFEGKILHDILILSGKETEYWYVRTWKEMQERMFQRFYDSNLRYLHISCHGSDDSISFTLDTIDFITFGEEAKEYLENRRLFFSACEVVNKDLAHAVLPGSDCYSLVGPNHAINFDDAVIMWATFYHLMLRDSKVMKRERMKAILSSLDDMFGQTFQLFRGEYSRASS
jgi:hypothetical protein